MSASAVLKLQRVGFSIEQVEALADFMDTQAASKADLAEVKAELKADLAEVKAELKAELSEVKAAIKTDNADMRSEIRLLEQRMTIRLGGMLVVITSILLAAIRYLPAH